MIAGLPDAIRSDILKNLPFPSRMGLPAEYAQLAQQIVENTMLNGCTIRLDGAARMPAK